MSANSQKTGWKKLKQNLPDDVLIDFMLSKKKCIRCGAKLGETIDCPVCEAERDSTFIEVKEK